MNQTSTEKMTRIWKKPANGKRVIVGMSGGVDSSVSAAELLETGHDVVGLFMKNWEEDDSAEYCAAAEDLADAQAVCERLDIHLETANFSHEYWDNVFEHFLAEYRAGRTPNPDVLCNREIKFKQFLHWATDLGADFIATGHYVQKGSNEAFPAGEGKTEYRLLKGNDPGKDQSYFLYTLGQEALAKSLFPIGHMQKSEVRARAEVLGLTVARKKDSTGICFIGERRFRDFLSQYLPAQKGEIVDIDGAVVGQHMGAMYYTIGQRSGLGIGGQNTAGNSGEPWYVVDKDVEKNQLTVVQGHDHPALLTTELWALSLSWVAEHPPILPFECRAKIRYRQTAQPCEIVTLGIAGFGLRFSAPQRAITPGQSVVLYDGDVCLGGGVIEHAWGEG